MHPQPLLQGRRGHALAAAGDDDVLLAAGERQIALGVEPAEVAGGEPALLEHLLGAGLVVDVPLEQGRAADQDLAVLGDVDVDAGQRSAHRAELLPAQRLHGDPAAGLGQPVAVVHEDADAGEEEGEFTVERGAAGDGAAQPTAERLTEFAVDALLVQGVLEPQIESGPGAGAQPLPFHGLGVVPGCPRRAFEQRAPAGPLGRGQEALVDPLEDRGHPVQISGAEGEQSGGQGLRVQIGFVRHQEAAAQAQRLDHQPVHVGERQEDQDGRLLPGRGRGVAPALEQGVAGAGQAAVGERAAAGPAAGAGGVGDDGGGVGQHDPAQ